MSASKRQIIITLCVALAAIAAIIATLIINKNGNEGTDSSESNSHLFSDGDIEVIKSITSDVTVYLFKSEESLGSSSDTAEVSYRMLMNDLSSLNPKIKPEYLSGSSAQAKKSEYQLENDLDSVFVSGDKKRVVSYLSLTKVHPVSGVVYAMDRGMLMDALCAVCGKAYEKSADYIAVTADYDRDGDTIGTNMRAFMYPNLERKDVKRIAITNKDDAYFAYRAADSSFFFAYDAGNGTVKENGEPDVYSVNTSYDASMTSSLVVSSVYTLSTSKLYDVDDAEYGLADKSKATLITEVFTESNEYHIIVVGDKTPSGTGYFAKYYYLYAKGALGSEDYIKLCEKADENDNIAKYTYAGKQFAKYGAEFYTKPFIYIIGTDIETAALHPLADYLTGELVYTVSDQKNLYTVDDIHVNFLKRNEEIVAKLLEEQEANGVSMQYLWKIVSPKEYFTGDFASPSDTFFEMLNTLVTLRSEKVLEYKMKKGDDGVMYFDTDVLKKYGLDSPELSYSYYYEDAANNAKTRTVVYLSEKNGDGDRYVYSNVYLKNDDGTESVYPTGIIALVKGSTVEWADLSCTKFIEPYIFNMFINYVNSITVEYDENKYDFVLLKSEDDVNDVSCNGIRVDLKSFRYFYQTILGVKTVDKYEPSGEELPEMLKLTIKTTKGDYNFVFYRISVKKALCKLNGEGSYYVNSDLITQIESEAEKISHGGILTKYD